MFRISEKQRFISHIDLSRIGFETHMMKVLEKCAWKFVTYVDFSKSILSSRGVVRLFRRNYRYLRELIVFECNISPKGAVILARERF